MDESAGKTVGARLRYHRKRLGWRPEEVATYAGVSVKTINAIELGVTENPGVLTMARIAKVLGTNLGDLVPEPPVSERMRPGSPALRPQGSQSVDSSEQEGRYFSGRLLPLRAA